MRIHSLEKIKQLKKLRRAGHSIEELVRALSMPKTTIWHHIHDIKLQKKYILRLRANQGGSKIKKQKELAKAEEEAKQLLSGKNNNPALIAAMLYWAEGSKGRCEFVNTDGDMIKLYLLIIRNYFRIPENKIQPFLRIFTNHDREESLSYWSKITKMPKNMFTVYHNDGGTSGRTRYGMCRIVIRRGGYLLKLFRAITNQICRNKIVSN